MVEKSAVHLICGAHLDPVWQWRWEEGAAEALATFGTAVELLNEHPGLVFCHNEAGSIAGSKASTPRFSARS